MNTGLSKAFVSIARNHPVVATELLSVLPFRLHRHWIAQQMLKEMTGSHLTVRSRLYNGMRVRTFVGDEVGDVIYSCGSWEPATVRLLVRLLGENKDTVFLDVGAHIGLYTLMAAPFAREVHSFEPMPWVYEVLKSNMIENKCTNVFPNPLGVRDYTGSAEVWQGPKENTGSGSFLRIQGFYERSYSVKCVTLDQYCKDRNLVLAARKLLLKIDAERSELEILRGADGLFQYNPIVILEFNDWSTDLAEIVHFFDQRNYGLEAICDSGLQRFGTVRELFPEQRQSKAVNILASPRQGM